MPSEYRPKENMTIMLRISLLFLLLTVLTVRAEDSVDPAPDVLVKQVVDEVLLTINHDKDITRDQKKMDALVSTKVLPHFDFPRMTRLTIGNKYWAETTLQDQQQLIDEYRIFLAHTFSNVIAQYTDQKIVLTPLHMRPGATNITVKTWVIPSSDEPTKLDYRMEKTASGWVIYDIAMDNMSLIRMFRSNFSDQLTHEGVQGLIKALHMKNQAVEVARHDLELPG